MGLSIDTPTRRQGLVSVRETIACGLDLVSNPSARILTMFIFSPNFWPKRLYTAVVDSASALLVQTVNSSAWTVAVPTALTPPSLLAVDEQGLEQAVSATAPATVRTVARAVTSLRGPAGQARRKHPDVGRLRRLSRTFNPTVDTSGSGD